MCDSARITRHISISGMFIMSTSDPKFLQLFLKQKAFFYFIFRLRRRANGRQMLTIWSWVCVI